MIKENSNCIYLVKINFSKISYIHLLTKEIFRNIVLSLILFFFHGNCSAFDHSRYKSGDSYSSVKNQLLNGPTKKIGKIVDFTDNYLVWSNGSADYTYTSYKEKLCSVLIFYKKINLPTHFIYVDNLIGENGTPEFAGNIGGEPGSGFYIRWRNQKDVVEYAVVKKNFDIDKFYENSNYRGDYEAYHRDLDERFCLQKYMYIKE